MNKNINRPDSILSRKPTVLVAPLDWGLGHATRCIPVIHILLKENCRVLIGAEGKTKALLQAEFPQLLFLPLRGYKIAYGANEWKLIFKIILQIPKLIYSIKREHKWLKKAVKEYGVDAVISDNRYGLYHPNIVSIFITHQLLIKSPLGRWSEKILQRLNYSYMARFTECWVPDKAGKENLAGALSHPIKKPKIPVYYVGPLTRFCFKDILAEEDYLLILLSGPEPQRTLLEQLLLQQLHGYNKLVLFVRGLPGETVLSTVQPTIKTVNHLLAAELEEAIQKASLVISRCGYSTVMDLMELKKQSILIPTPGQTEQEYIAAHLMQQQYAFCIDQAYFNLSQAVEMANGFPYKTFPNSYKGELQKRIQGLINSLIGTAG